MRRRDISGGGRAGTDPSSSLPLHNLLRNLQILTYLVAFLLQELLLLLLQTYGCVNTFSTHLYDPATKAVPGQTLQKSSDVLKSSKKKNYTNEGLKLLSQHYEHHKFYLTHFSFRDVISLSSHVYTKTQNVPLATKTYPKITDRQPPRSVTYR